MSEGGFTRESVLDWLEHHAEWKLYPGSKPPLRVAAINGRQVAESHRDTLHRWIASDRDPIPMGRWDEILLACGTMLWEFELEYPDSYVPGADGV